MAESSLPETVKAEDVQGNQYAVNYQEKQNVLRMEINQTGDYFLTDGKSESIGNQTDEESVEAVSDGEDTGFTEEPMPESVSEAERQNRKQRASAKQFLMIILTLPAVCILVAAIIFAIRKKRR